MTWFWWDFKGRFLGTSKTDSNSLSDICPGKICPYLEYYYYYYSLLFEHYKGSALIHNLLYFGRGKRLLLLVYPRQLYDGSIGSFPKVCKSKMFSYIAARAFPQSGCSYIHCDRHAKYREPGNLVPGHFWIKYRTFFRHQRFKEKHLKLCGSFTTSLHETP